MPASIIVDSTKYRIKMNKLGFDPKRKLLDMGFEFLWEDDKVENNEIVRLYYYFERDSNTRNKLLDFIIKCKLQI